MSAKQETIEFELASEAVAFLNDQCWHDSVLHEIVIIRTASADRVLLKLDLLSDWENQVSSRVELAFNKCMHASTQMYGGVISMSEGEMIYAVECSDTDPVIDSIKEELSRTDVNHGIFRMEMGTTGSSIELVFSGISLKQVGETGQHTAPPPLYPDGSK